MGTTLDALKGFKAWQVGVLAAALVGAAGATYGVYTVLNGSGKDVLQEGQQSIPIRYGNLVNDVSISGSLVYPDRETLTFGTQGTVVEVLVEEGQQVETGQLLASLDPETIASLERAVAQAQVDLRDAEDALVEVKDPHTALEIARSEADVANARLTLENARDALETLLKLPSQEIAVAEQRVADAKLTLKNARDALGLLMEPTAQDIASAEARVSNARLTLRDSQDALGLLLKPTSQDVAGAAAKVARAKLTLRDSQDALGLLLEPTSEDMAAARARVADAKLSLKNAQDALAGLLKPTSLDITQAEAEVVSARLSVEQAREALATAKSGASEEDIASAQSQVDFADTSLANARRDLTLTRRARDDRLTAARDSADDALQEYQTIFKKWLGIDIGDEESDVDPTTLLKSWGVDLGFLYDPATSVRFTRDIPADNPDTLWNETVVYAWLFLYPGSVLATCGDLVASPRISCVKEEIDATWDAYQAARDNLDTVQTQEAKALASAETAVARAEEDVAAAQEDLQDLKAPPDPLEIENEAARLEVALATLAKAEEDMSELKNGPDAVEVEAKQRQVALAAAALEVARADLALLVDGPAPLDVDASRKDVVLAAADLKEAEAELATLVDGAAALEIEAKRKQVALAAAELEDAEADLATLTDGASALEVEAQAKRVAVAQADLDQAIEDLATLREGADPLEVEAKRKQIVLARAGLDDVEEKLADLTVSADPLEVALRETQVAAARATLEATVQRLENATLEAPWAGVISLVNVDVGQPVNPNTPAFEIVDPTTVEVDGIVDEIDVLFLREGAQASVTMDALPGQELAGSVSAIASAAQNQQGVVTYPVRIRVSAPPGVQLPEGLSAAASVVIREDRDVLLVPLQALYGTFEEPVVRVMLDGRIEERRVLLGNSDDFWAVVKGGLAEGDLVVMEARQATTGGLGLGSFGGSFRRFGGGGGGRGRPPGGFPGGGGSGGGFGGGQRN